MPDLQSGIFEYHFEMMQQVHILKDESKHHSDDILME